MVSFDFAILYDARVALGYAVDITALHECEGLEYSKLIKCASAHVIKDNLIIIELDYNYTTVKYMVMRCESGVCLTNMPNAALKTFLYDVMGCSLPYQAVCKFYPNGIHVHRKQAAMLQALLEHCPYHVYFISEGVHYNMKCKRGILRVYSADEEYTCNLLTDVTFVFNIQDLITASQNSIPVKYTLYPNPNNSTLVGIATSMELRCEDVDFGLRYYVRDDLSCITDNDMFLIASGPIALQTPPRNSTSEKELAELIDSYCALHKDGEFSKHIVTLLDENGVDFDIVATWLRREVKRLQEG